MVYLGLETSLHGSILVMLAISAIHIILSISVTKLAFDVTNCDTSHMTEEEEKRLARMKNTQL